MEVLDKLKRAYLRVIKNDRHLLAITSNERSITHRFAMYIQQEFPEFDVDCEYNRTGIDPKRLKDFRKLVESNDTEGVTVFPDVIVHLRGTAHNYIVVEAKKSDNDNGCSGNGCVCDRCKLSLYKSQLSYQYAFYAVFPIGKKLEGFSVDKLDNFLREI